jgi:hypothetical protein
LKIVAFSLVKQIRTIRFSSAEKGGVDRKVPKNNVKHAEE